VEIYLGGGCFWELQNRLDQLEGVMMTVAGYMKDAQGWVEVVKVAYQMPLEELLRCYFACHDPTSYNRQGMAVGYAYRSAIYWEEPLQREMALKVKADLDTGRPPLTEVLEVTEFVEAPEEENRLYEKKGISLKLPEICK